LKYFKKLSLVVHPFLFTAFFVLALYSANVAEVSPSEIWIPLFAALGFTLLMLLLAVLIIGFVRKLQKPSNSSQPYQFWDIKKAAILASIFVVLFFTFGYALRASGGWDDMHRTLGNNLYLLLSIFWLALLIIISYFAAQTSRDLGKVTILLSIIAITLVMISTGNVIVNETKTAAQDTNESEKMVDLVKPDVIPDIYYIVLDRYASANTLKEVYDFDNSEFIDFLNSKGFYVANQSVSNYPYTGTSLLSSLNMDFIHEEGVAGRTYSGLQDYEVWRALKSVGYEFIHFGSWLESTRKNPYADININYNAMPEFSSFLFQTTWAYPWCLTLGIVDEWWETQYDRVIYKFDKLAEIPEIEQSTFTFAHMLIPHPPYVFNRDGSEKSIKEYRERSLKVQYVDQLIALNDMLKVTIDELLVRSEVPPIIILQSDEGPYPGGENVWKTKTSSVGFEGATESELREKYGILNAYYLPDVDEDILNSSLYPSITPVNSFRQVFNLYFNADYELLPDRSYAPYKNTLFSFFEVTDKVKYD